MMNANVHRKLFGSVVATTRDLQCLLMYDRRSREAKASRCSRRCFDRNFEQCAKFLCMHEVRLRLSKQISHAGEAWQLPLGGKLDAFNRSCHSIRGDSSSCNLNVSHFWSERTLIRVLLYCSFQNISGIQVLRSHDHKLSLLSRYQ
jgi:hypothetical protein